MTTAPDPTSVRAVAFHDLAARDEARRRDREEHAARRARDEALANEKALDDFLTSKVATDWLPGVRWELVTRHGGHRTVVVRSVEAHPVYLVVTRQPSDAGYSWITRVPTLDAIARNAKRQTVVDWLVGALQVNCAADIGDALRRQEQTAAALLAEADA